MSYDSLNLNESLLLVSERSIQEPLPLKHVLLLTKLLRLLLSKNAWFHNEMTHSEVIIICFLHESQSVLPDYQGNIYCFAKAGDKLKSLTTFLFLI